MKEFLLIALTLVGPFVIKGQPSEIPEKERREEYERREYKTKHVGQLVPPEIDGLINDPVWEEVAWAGDFTVYAPNNGDLPLRESRFKFIYDSKNIYLAIRCFHEDPSQIENRLARRDNFPGDWVEINIDSYFDRNTAFSFNLSVSGVKGDEFVSGNGSNWDSNWNPVWYGKTHIDDEGWTAEIQIPLSQIRFGDKEEHVWGLNVLRRDFGADERSAWQWIPQNFNGWVSHFGNLHGIHDIEPVVQFELQPYVAGSFHTSEGEEGNPFADGVATRLNFGLDGKYALASDITLDFTINPDFGQVEADPSVLTLDGFQIFFSERRPFFIENANLFSFQVSQLAAGGPFSNDNLFYSRRIGSRPSGIINVSNNAYVDLPNFTNILGAAKISGKTRDGWSISVLESVTAEESATIEDQGERFTKVIEPLSNYFVAGLAKDLRNGATIIKGQLTAVHRDLDRTGLEDQFHERALSGGVDLFHSWKAREWQIRANYMFSEVRGSAQKILNTQQSFEHYFNRPDADHLGIDEDLNSLTGNGGTFSIGNYGGADNLSFQTGLTFRSPGLELNDIGFLATADEINHVSWMGYKAPQPFSVFRSFQINLNHFQRWTTAGEYLYHAANTNLFFSFKNYWSVGSGFSYDFLDYSTKALFGGPILRRSPGFFSWIDLQSDSRKKFVAGIYLSGGQTTGRDTGAVSGRGIKLSFRYQPSDRLSLSVEPSYNASKRVIQYVSTAAFAGHPRYITATVKQKTFSVPLRLNYSFTPDLSLQYWGQPFVSRGNYHDYKYITDPRAEVYTSRYQLYTEAQLNRNEDQGIFLVDENLDGVVDYEFEDPEFNFLQWRSNLVMRWEYRPGSEFYLVWTQSTTNFGNPEKDIFPSLADDLFGRSFNNIFLFKVTYRFVNN